MVADGWQYFYMTFDRPPHAVMHFGMTGWMKFNSTLR